MKCALWLNRRKIRHASEIPQNLDIASLRGYLEAGSLLKWLDANGGSEYADKLRGVPLDSPDLNEKIAEAFGTEVRNSCSYKSFGDELYRAVSQIYINGAESFDLSSYPELSSYGSFLEVWEKMVSGSGTGSGSSSLAQLEAFFALINKLETSAFTFGSGGSGWSFREWLYQLYAGTSSFALGSSGSGWSFWEWLYQLYAGTSSFTLGSSGSGWSFREWLYQLYADTSSFTLGSGGSGLSFWEWLFQQYAGNSSFTFGSGGSGWSFWEWLFQLYAGTSSFTFGSGGSGWSFWEWLYQLYSGTSSFTLGSSGSFICKFYGSFSYDFLKNLPFDEYDFIMFKTLYENPLDRYGYGIHNI